MSVEIKQMVIKSNIVSGKFESNIRDQPIIDIDELRETMIEVCKELISEKLSEMQER